MAKSKLYDEVRTKLDYVSTKLSNAIREFHHEGKTNAILDIVDSKSADIAEKRQFRLDKLVARGYAKTASDWDFVKWACARWNEYKFVRPLYGPPR